VKLIRALATHITLNIVLHTLNEYKGSFKALYGEAVESNGQDLVLIQVGIDSPIGTESGM
jgi:hypothetical protein